MTIDELPARAQAALCQTAVTCGGYPDEATCVDLFPGEVVFKPIVDAVKRGTLAFDGALMSACLNEMNAECQRNAPEPPACAQALQGRVAAGGACVSGAECIGGGTCAKPESCNTDYLCCAGTCGPPRVGVGGDCSQTLSMCQEGATCMGGVCVADAAAGAPCSSTTICARPAFCRNSGGDSGTCVLPAPSGAACDPTEALGCARSDEYCEITTSVCTKSHPPGAACTSDDMCVEYAFCQNGACVAPTAGAACDYAAGAKCMDGLACTGGVCTKPSYEVCGS